MYSMEKWNLKKIFKSGGGCGCGSKATEIIEPKPRPKPEADFSDQKPSNRSSSSASSWYRRGGAAEEDNSSTTFSLKIDASPQFFPENHVHVKSSETVIGPCAKLRDSFAIVKDSDDPYTDFRNSMLQMIFEKEIYSGHDLQQLLDCFLQLNSPHHYEVIVKAFMEIWNGVVDDEEDETPP